MKLKHLHTLAGAFIFSLALHNSVNAQCGVQMAGGAAYNLFTIANNQTNPIVANKALNTIAFVHRHNSNVFGGNSGNFRYDVSTNGGASWTVNQGVLNPLSTSAGRYPNAVIYNPAGNTTPNNAYLGYLGATIDGSGYWSGVVSGVRKLNGTGNTEHYNQVNTNSYFVPASTVKGAAGVYWALNLSSDGLNPDGEIHIYKGTWNGVNDITWNMNSVLAPPFDYSYSGYPVVGDYSIGFDPTGTTGWLSMMTDLSSGPSAYTYYPVFYKTTDGGNTWQGPIEVPLEQFSCITSNITPGYDVGAVYNCDMTVDVKGNPHLLITVGNANSSYGLDYTQWHHMVDITQISGLWTAYDIANVKGGQAIFNGSAGSALAHNFAPQVTRSEDGAKLFFGWTDNNGYALGDPNTSPDLYAKALDVQQYKWTPIKNFSACNVNTANRILFSHFAEEVLEPSPGIYKIAPVYAEFTVAGDPDQPVNFKFLDNATFLTSDFTINQPTLSVSIVQGNTALLCPGSSLNLQVNGSYTNVLWSNFSTSNNTQIYNGGIYYVAARNGCVLGSDTIMVNTVSINITPNSSQVCAGSPVTLSVTGNAYSYSLAPSLTQGTSFTVYPVAGNSYFNILGSGDQGCSYGQGISIPINPLPTVIAITNHTQVCAGISTVLQATGTNISLYSWSNGATTPSVAVVSDATTVYTVTAVSVQGCSTSTTITQYVIPCVGIKTFNKDVDVLTVYPNPSAGDISVKAAADASLQVMNELGQLVRTISLNTANDHTATVSNLQKGIYFVTGQCGNQTIRQKIIIE